LGLAIIAKELCRTLLHGLNLASYEPTEAIENINKADFNDLIEIAEEWLETSTDTANDGTGRVDSCSIIWNFLFTRLKNIIYPHDINELTKNTLNNKEFSILR